MLSHAKQTRKACLCKVSVFSISYFPYQGTKRISAFCGSGVLIAGIRCRLGSTQLTTSAGWCAQEFSANWTQILLEGNKVFPSLYPKIEEGETILLQACAKMIRETNKSHSQLHSPSLSSLKRCFACSSADIADPKLPKVPRRQCGEERGSNATLSAF